MLLAINANNTNTVFALWDGDRLHGVWRIATEAKRTADEYVVWLDHLLGLGGLARGRIDGTIIASVVGEDGVELGIKALVDRPGEVGADRLINTIAAHDRYPGASIIVDFGTATTFDVVDDEGNYRGGVIAPGINLSLQALQQAAAKLPSVAIRATAKVIGTNTVACMQSGIYWGYVGLIEGIVTRITKEYGAPMRVIATGGLAPVFEHASPLIERIDGTLNLWGMRLVYERNRPKTIAV